MMDWLMLMPLRWIKSLRFQLTLWSLATTAAILLIASLLGYAFVRSALQRETDQALQSAAAAVLRRLAPDEPAEPGGPPEQADPAAVVREAHLASVVLPGVGSTPLCLRLAGAGTGESAAVSPALAENRVLLAVLAAQAAHPHGPEFAGSTDDAQIRSLAVPLPGSRYVLQVAVPWDPVEDLLTELIGGMALASLLFLLLSGVGSGLLVGRALRPIDQIVSEAETLTPDRLGAAPLGPQALSDTEIGHLVAALNRMLRRISSSFAAQRQFTADASHELRTPLTILRGQFELALSRPRPAAEYRETLQSGLEEVLRMARIVESLAFLTRGEAAGPPGRFASLSFSALAADAASALAGRAEEKNLRLAVETSGEAPVRGDADALRRLVQNLVENAIAYTPAGGAVTVTVAENAGQCRLAVTDTGTGIAADDLPHVFDRFFRADPARVHTGGSGLGLSIVQSIAEAHGGTVSAESKPGQGSVFSVCLPCEHLAPEYF